LAIAEHPLFKGRDIAVSTQMEKLECNACSDCCAGRIDSRLDERITTTVKQLFDGAMLAGLRCNDIDTIHSLERGYFYTNEVLEVPNKRSNWFRINSHANYELMSPITKHHYWCNLKKCGCNSQCLSFCGGDPVCEQKKKDCKLDCTLDHIKCKAEDKSNSSLLE
jgi:hypothetical protein